MSELLEIRRVANGWLVRSPDYSQNTAMEDNETYVFTSAKTLSDFVFHWTEKNAGNKEEAVTKDEKKEYKGR